MKINTFDLEKKLHKLNQALLYKKSEVVINFTEHPENRTYQCIFTKEFLEDIEALIEESTEAVYVFIEFVRSDSTKDILICDEKTDYEMIFKTFEIEKATPIKFYTIRTDNYIDVELLYRIHKAASDDPKWNMLSHGNPIEHFPYYKKTVDSATLA